MTVRFGNDGHEFASYMSLTTSSFSDVLTAQHPDTLTWRQAAPDVVADLPHGTTIVALNFAGGVVLAGDRQVTSGTSIAYRYGEKVYPADDTSCLGVAGTSALAFEIAKLFRMELLHYEKIEGERLSLPGKATKLGSMVRNNLSLAMQGLTMVPLFAGYDADTGGGRIFSYDPIGSMSEEHQGFYSIGSGSPWALGSLKKLHDPAMDEAAAVAVALEALYDASENDTATMGPDLARRIFPLVRVATAEGERGLDDDEVEAVARRIVEQRLSTPEGPRAPLSVSDGTRSTTA